MQKGFTILACCTLLLLALSSISFCLPPPCEFYPNSAYQGTTVTVDMPLLCGIAEDGYQVPTLIFNVPGMEVVNIYAHGYAEYVVTIKLAPNTPPGEYAPHVFFGDKLAVTAEEASHYWLTFTVLTSPDGIEPCIFYPDSVVQGESKTLDLYLHCASLNDSDQLPTVIFDGVDITVAGIRKKAANTYSVDLQVASDVAPGTYSPYILLADSVVLSADDALANGLMVKVNESPPSITLYPDSPQRTGTSSMYLIKGSHTNFANGSSFVSVNHKGIFSIFQYVFTPSEMVVVLTVLYDVEPGYYDLTIVTEDMAVTGEGGLTVID